MGIVLYIIAIGINKIRGDNSYSETDIKKVVMDSTKDYINRFGSEEYNVVRHNLKTLGETYKIVDIRESGRLTGIETEDNIDKLNGKVGMDKEDIDFLIDNNIISEDMRDHLEDSKDISHILLAVRPASFIKKCVWFMVDSVLGFSVLSDYILVPRFHIVDNPADGSITIPDYVQFRKVAGLFVSMDRSSLSILDSVVYRNLYEMVLEDHSNYHKKINWFNSKHAQDMQKEKMKARIEQAIKRNQEIDNINK